MAEIISNIQTSDNETGLIGGNNFDSKYWNGSGSLTSGLSIAVGATSTISLASKIPDDGHDYEINLQYRLTCSSTTTTVAICLAAYSGTGTQGMKGYMLRAAGNPYLGCDICREYCTIIKSSDRAITLSNEGSAAITVNLFNFKQYRRIGTNA